MKALVTVKRVLDYNVKPRVKSDGSGVDLANVKMSMNPFDEISIEEAIRLKEAGKASEIIAVSVGPQQAALRLKLMHTDPDSTQRQRRKRQSRRPGTCQKRRQNRRSRGSAKIAKLRHGPSGPRAGLGRGVQLGDRRKACPLHNAKRRRKKEAARHHPRPVAARSGFSCARTPLRGHHR